MTQRLNYSVVEDKLSSFSTSCDSLYNAIKAMDEAVGAGIGQNSGAINGSLGRQLARDWENNCSMFTNFKGMFDEWHGAAVDICTSNAEFETENKGIGTSYEESPSGDSAGGTV